MPDLATLQQRISAALTERTRDENALTLIEGGASRARERLAIYRGNIAANAALALAAIYPIVYKLVGAEFFDGLARAYCAAHPSISGDLNELGEHVADFVQSFAPAQSLPYLPDVARLEWLAHQAHYAGDHAPLDATKLAGLSEEDYPRLALRLHPAVAMVNSAYPLLRIWEVHQIDYRSEIAVDLGSGGGDVIVYRPQYRATVAALTRAEAAFLAAITHGELLGAALGRAVAADTRFDLATSLKRWTTENIVVDLSVPE
jgi:hypothetical protein